MIRTEMSYLKGRIPVDSSSEERYRRHHQELRHFSQVKVVERQELSWYTNFREPLYHRTPN